MNDPADAPLKAHFLLNPDVVFLNHGSFGACPREVFEALQAWQLEMERNPVEFLGRRSGELLAQARQALAHHLSAQAADLVFVPNATTGVNVVARSLNLRPGDEILATDHEYGACDATWQRVCEQAGAVYRKVEIPLPFGRELLAEQVLAAVTPRTRMIFASHITSTTALIFPLEELCARARARGVLTLIDGAHAPGHIEVQLDTLGADFYTGNCHKWLCAPKGSAFLHARAEHHQTLHATVTSWGYVAGTQGHTGFDAYTGRTVLERRMQWQGTRDIAAWLSVPAALAFQQRHVWPEVRQRCHDLAIGLMQRTAERFNLPAIGSPEDFGQMVPLPVPHQDAEALRARLFEQHRIEVPVTQHAGRTFVRVSVQGYNTADDLAALEAAL
ncbi:MAG: aminotransferase class V-fold PLP-dependent enzyme [Rubrivivax sp.]